MLADHVREGEEAYEFTWVGKKAAMVEANRPIRKTLRPCVEESKDWDTTQNLYIEGDNLEALKLLQESYLGKVDMIFIDPPYNTGSDVFVYNDNFKLSDDEIEEKQQMRDDDGNILFEINQKTEGKFHSNWLSMMYPRLKVSQKLLSSNGVIFIMIDSPEEAALRMVCDEVFGLSCFIGEMIWKCSDNSNNNALRFSEDHNYILVYSARPDWKPNFLNDPAKRKHFKNPDNDPKGPWFDGNPVNNPGLRPNLQFDITSPSGKIIHCPPNGWRWSKETMDEKFKTGELRFSDDESRVIRRTYLKDMKGLPPSTLCVDLQKTGHNRGAKYELKKLFPECPVTDLFSTPKPTLLLKYLLSIGSNSNSIIMDFFSGSASMADAVMQHNAEQNECKKYIMVQMQEPCDEKNKSFANICEMGKERIRRSGERIKKEHREGNVDIGFRALKVDSSNMNDVYYNAEDLTQDLVAQTEDNIKSDRTSLDLLFGCLVDWGVPLSLPYTSETIDGCTVHDYADGALIACFDRDVPESVIRAIAARQPERAVFRDSSFADSPAKINVTEIFKRLSPDTDVRVL